MNEIYKTFYGSELYGTTIPTSDCDTVSIMVPKIDDVLVGHPDIESFQKISNDADTTRHSLLSFAKGLKSGNATMLEIFFSSYEHNSTIYMNDLWLELTAMKSLIVSARCDSMIGYCRAQAKMYDLRGDRLAAVVDAKGMISRFIKGSSPSSPMERFMDSAACPKLIYRHPDNISIENIPIGGGKSLLHLVVSGKKIPITASLGIAYQILEKREKEYGERVRAAMDTANTDWKGMMHSIRISEQTLEYLNTGHITFPRPNAMYLKDIRLGKIDYKKVAEEIQKNLVDIDAARANTRLRPAPDEDAIDKWTIKVYRALDGEIHA